MSIWDLSKARIFFGTVPGSNLPYMFHQIICISSFNFIRSKMNTLLYEVCIKEEILPEILWKNVREGKSCRTL